MKFEDITSDLEKTLAGYGKSPEVYAAFDQRIALVKHLYNTELEKPVWERRCWEFHGFREAEKALVDPEPPGKQFLNLDDIVYMSPVWEGLRREIKSAEASASEQ